MAGPPRDEAKVAALVESVRRELIEHALAVYEDASARGLCAEGAWEAAIGAMRQLDLSRLGGEGRSHG